MQWLFLVLFLVPAVNGYAEPSYPAWEDEVYGPSWEFIFSPGWENFCQLPGEFEEIDNEWLVCSAEGAGSQKEIGQKNPSFPQEMIPFNRFSKDWLEAQGKELKKRGWTSPEIVNVQKYKGKSYGIRWLSNLKALNKHLMPGDILVYYRPVLPPKLGPKDAGFPKSESSVFFFRLVERGQFHNAIIVPNCYDSNKGQEKYLFKPPGKAPPAKFCHLHSPRYHSKPVPDFGQGGAPVHVLRVVAADAKKSNELNEKAASWATQIYFKDFKFDGPMRTDVLADGLEKERKKIIDACKKGSTKKLNPLYCPEYPFVSHCLSRERVVCKTGYSPNEILTRFTEVTKNKDLINHPKVKALLGGKELKDVFKSHLINYLGLHNNLNDFTKGFIRNLLNKVFMDKDFYAKQKENLKFIHYEPLVPGWPLDMALGQKQSQGVKILYVGSYEQPKMK